MAEKRRRSVILTLVAIVKLIKALTLFAVALGVHHLLRSDVQETLLHWERAIRVDPDNRFAHAVLTRVTGLSPKRMEEIGLATLLYGTMFLVEGTGLMLMKRWAIFYRHINGGVFAGGDL